MGLALEWVGRMGEIVAIVNRKVEVVPLEWVVLKLKPIDRNLLNVDQWFDV